MRYSKPIDNFIQQGRPNYLTLWIILKIIAIVVILVAMISLLFTLISESNGREAQFAKEVSLLLYLGMKLKVNLASN